MNETVSLHRRAWDLIPWILNGSASAADRQAVEQHLQQCDDCRAELAFQRSLQSALQQQPVPVSDAQAWQRFAARLDEPGPLVAEPAALAGTRSWMPWAVAAMVIEAVAIGALGSSIWWPPAAPVMSASTVQPYRTLAAPGATVSAARIRAVFAPSMTLDQLQSLLSVSGLQIVAGPSSANVWSLGAAPGAVSVDVPRALQELRANPAVRFAEPVEDAP